jgi:uroporphyrin-III C-methyltransferase
VIVMYMAVKHLREIAQSLIQAGREAGDPVTIVSNATMADQVIHETTLGDVEVFLAKNNPPTPAIVAVGKISSWRPLLDWYRGDLRSNPIG